MEYRVFGPREYSVDLCAFLTGTFSHILVDLVTAHMKRVSKENNIFHPCPFSVSMKNEHLKKYIFEIFYFIKFEGETFSLI